MTENQLLAKAEAFIRAARADDAVGTDLVAPLPALISRAPDVEVQPPAPGPGSRSEDLAEEVARLRAENRRLRQDLSRPSYGHLVRLWYSPERPELSLRKYPRILAAITEWALSAEGLSRLSIRDCPEVPGSVHLGCGFLGDRREFEVDFSGFLEIGHEAPALAFIRAELESLRARAEERNRDDLA